MFTARMAETPCEKVSTIRFSETDKTMETPYYSIRFNEAYEFTSIYDKEAERELLADGQTGNALLAFEDRPKEYDCWNIDAYYVEKCYEVKEVLGAELAEQGAVRTVLRVTKRFHNSVIAQDIIFYEHSPRIDFVTTIDWKESQVLLKAAFPLDVVTDKATFDIQYGNVERPTHSNTSWEQAKFEVCAHKWVDVAEAGFGVALLNDCKYGYDVKGSTIRLTMLKSGIFPNPEADQEMHEFTYALYPHRGDFREGGVVKEAYLLNVSNSQVSGHVPPKQTEKSYVHVSAENVVLETVKPAEASEDIVLRFYESHGKRTKTVVKVAAELSEIVETDLMEKELCKADTGEGTFCFTIKPYEIKTFRLKLK